MKLEKRKHRRVKTHIDCIVFDNENKEEVFGEITDISAHGIGIKFNKKSTHLTVEIKLSF